MKPPLTSLADALPASVPFVGPETQERATGRKFLARLGANESVFGASPKVAQAIAKAASDAWMYGDPEMFDLRQALGAHLGIAPDCVLPGEGVDGLLGYLARLFVEPGTPVVTSEGAYPTFAFHVAGFGGVLHKVPYRDDHEDPQALLAKARETGARLIYLANPDNPMGSWHRAEIITAMIAELPPGSLLVLDEAYAEMAPDGAIPPLDPGAAQVIRLRSFSKAYGLAGMRIGYAIGNPDLIASFHKIRNHFGLGRVAQAAALAALDDQPFLRQVLAQIAQARDEIARIGAAHGLRALPSATNFVALDCGRDGAFARRLLQALTARGIFLRMPFVAPQDRCIRVSCGKAEDLARFAEALAPALEEARASISEPAR